MKKFLYPVIIWATVLFANSCDFDDVIATNLQGVCAVVDGVLVTQEGIVLEVEESECGTDWLNHEKIHIIYDALSQSDFYVYNIRLKSFDPVKITDVIKKSEADEGTIGNDPICLASGPIVGFELVANVYFTSRKDSVTRHEVNLVFDDERSSVDSVFFTLRHNAYGECYKEGEDINEFQTDNGYYSFNLKDFIPTDKPTVVASFSWEWYKMGTEGSIISPETISATESIILMTSLD